MAQQKQPSKKAAAKKPTTADKSAETGSKASHQEEQRIVPEERHRMIAEAAYVIAEQRGFEGDKALDDWLQAEAEVDASSSARH